MDDMDVTAQNLGDLHDGVRVHIPLVVVCDEAVVRRTLGLIALFVIVVLVVAIFHRILLYWRLSVYTPPSVTVNCCWMLPNCEL